MDLGHIAHGHLILDFPGMVAFGWVLGLATAYVAKSWPWKP